MNVASGLPSGSLSQTALVWSSAQSLRNQTGGLHTSKLQLKAFSLFGFSVIFQNEHKKICITEKKSFLGSWPQRSKIGPSYLETRGEVLCWFFSSTKMLFELKQYTLQIVQIAEIKFWAKFEQDKWILYCHSQSCAMLPHHPLRNGKFWSDQP